MTSIAPVVTLSPRDYDAVVFDLDGVLIRTVSVHAPAWKRQEFPHSTKFSGGARHCSAKTPGGEDLEIQEPIPRGDFATFHFDSTLPGMLGSTLIRDQFVERR